MTEQPFGFYFQPTVFRFEKHGKDNLLGSYFLCSAKHGEHQNSMLVCFLFFKIVNNFLCFLWSLILFFII